MTTTPADTLAANKAVATAFMDAIAAGDLDKIKDLLAPGAKWWVLGSGERERDSFIQALSATILTAASRTMEVVGLTAEGDRVAVEGQGEFIFPHGAYRNTYHHLLTVKDGKIVYGKEYMDTAVARQFFPLPAPVTAA